jgi:tetratricopeptide (TPR) repeat protein
MKEWNAQFSMKELPPPASTHLLAAQGWMELGNHVEANEELERITPTLRSHPDVLRVRYEVYSAAKKWEAAAEIAQMICQLAPDNSFGWIHCAYALHELKRTREALNVLLPALSKFPNDDTMHYNAACYYCQLGDRKSAWACLERAIDLVGSSEIKLRALDDPDLKSLWLDIEEI